MSHSVEVYTVSLCFCFCSVFFTASLFFSRREIINGVEFHLMEATLNQKLFVCFVLLALCAAPPCIRGCVWDTARFCDILSICVNCETMVSRDTDGPVRRVSNTTQLSHCSDHSAETVCPNCGDFLSNLLGFCHRLKIFCHVLSEASTCSFLDDKSQGMNKCDTWCRWSRQSHQGNLSCSLECTIVYCVWRECEGVLIFCYFVE